MTVTGLPHSGISGSSLACQLTEAYRRLLRPSSPPDAKASTVCPFILTQHHIHLGPHPPTLPQAHTTLPLRAYITAVYRETRRPCGMPRDAAFKRRPPFNASCERGPAVPQDRARWVSPTAPGLGRADLLKPGSSFRRSPACSHPRRDRVWLHKGGDPAAGSPTATLLRLHPNHRPDRWRLPPLRVG